MSYRRSQVVVDTRYGRVLGLLFVVAIIFLVCPHGMDFSTSSEDVDAVQGGWALRIQWPGLFLIAGLILVRRRALTLALLRDINPFLLAFLLYAGLTILWSPFPEVTIRKLVLIYGMTVITLSPFVAAWQPDRFVNLMRFAISALLLASLLVCIFLPSIGVEQSGAYTGHWKGVANSKGPFGLLCTVGIILWVHALAAGHARARAAGVWLALTVMMLLLSASTTALITSLLLAPLTWFWARPPTTNRRWLTIALLSAVVAGILLYFTYTLQWGLATPADLALPILELFGKNLTLTGRTELWSLMWEQIQHHMVFGYGFCTFWLGDAGASAAVVAKLQYTAWHSHNGFVDILNETGVVGLTLMLLFFILHTMQIWRLSLVDRGNAALHAVLFLLIIMSNMTITSFFRPLDLLAFLLLASSFAVGRALSRVDDEFGLSTADIYRHGTAHDRVKDASYPVDVEQPH